LIEYQNILTELSLSYISLIHWDILISFWYYILFIYIIGNLTIRFIYCVFDDIFTMTITPSIRYFATKRWFSFMHIRSIFQFPFHANWSILYSSVFIIWYTSNIYEIIFLVLFSRFCNFQYWLQYRQRIIYIHLFCGDRDHSFGSEQMIDKQWGGGYIRLLPNDIIHHHYILIYKAIIILIPWSWDVIPVVWHKCDITCIFDIFHMTHKTKLIKMRQNSRRSIKFGQCQLPIIDFKLRAIFSLFSW